MDNVDLEFEFPWKSDERDHDLRTDLGSFALYFGRRFKNGASLHSGNRGINNAQSAAAMAQHRIKFVQLVHTTRNLIDRHSQFVRQFVLLSVIVRQKFVQRRIEKTT